MQVFTILRHAHGWVLSRGREALLQPIARVSWCYRKVERIKSPSVFHLLCVAAGFFWKPHQDLNYFFKKRNLVCIQRCCTQAHFWMPLCYGYRGAFRKGTCGRGCTRLSTSSMAAEVTESRMGKTWKASQRPSVGTGRWGKSPTSDFYSSLRCGTTYCRSLV